MKKKRLFLLTLSLVAFLAFGGGALSLRNGTALAEDVPTKTGFYVIDGASIRLKEEYENFGIRFKAKVSETVEGVKYNMLILPTVLVEYYNNDTTENKADIVTYMKDLASRNNGSLSIVEDCAVMSDGYIYGSIVNLLWNNINRDFTAVAFYEKDGAVVLADNATDGNRSVITVVDNAIKSGDYDETDETTVNNKKILVDMIRMGEKQAAGYGKEDTYINEDFRYATNNKFIQITYGKNDSWSYPSIVKSGDDYALQFKRQNDAYNLLTLDFGEVKAGTYKLTFKMTENAIGEKRNENGDVIEYNNWKLMGYNGTTYSTDLGFLYKNYYVGNDTFEYYFTKTDDAVLKFGIAGMDANNSFFGQGQILLDDMCLEPIESIPTKENKLNEFTEVDFDDMVSPFIPLSNYGIYTRSNMTLSVDADYAEKTKSLTASSSAYGLIVFYLGTVVPGNYKLTVNAEIKDNFPAIMGGVYMTMGSDGNISYDTTTTISNMYLNYNLSDFTPTADGSYEIPITVTKTLSNYGLYFANNVQQSSSLVLNKVSFEKIDYTKGYTFDFEDKITIKNSTSTMTFDDIYILSIANTGGATNQVLIEKTADENGNNSLHVKDSAGWNQWVRIWVGYLEAGTYTVSLDCKHVSGSYQFLSNNEDGNGWKLTSVSNCTQDGNRYTYTFTLNTAVTDGYLGVRNAGGNSATGFEVYIDNLTITKTA